MNKLGQVKHNIYKYTRKIKKFNEETIFEPINNKDQPLTYGDYWLYLRTPLLCKPKKIKSNINQEIEKIFNITYYNTQSLHCLSLNLRDIIKYQIKNKFIKDII